MTTDSWVQREDQTLSLKPQINHEAKTREEFQEVELSRASTLKGQGMERIPSIIHILVQA